MSDMRPEYQSGAQNAVRTCLNIRSGDRVAVIEDREHADIAGAVKEEVEQTGPSGVLTQRLRHGNGPPR